MSSINGQSRENMVINRATIDDAPFVRDMVIAAYAKYVERIGRPPAPMTVNYVELIQLQEVYLLRVHNDRLGSLVIEKGNDSIKIDNLVVDPSAQGQGYGRALMQFAEDLALSQGIKAITLFTNVKMYENITLYKRLGFAETERRTEDGYDRVYFRKKLQ